MDNVEALNLLNFGFISFLVEIEQHNEQQGRRRRRRAYWVKYWLKPERRLTVGHYHQLMEELRLDDQESF